MSCFICNIKCEPWILLKNENIGTEEENKPLGKTVRTCGYSCCRKLTSVLPRNYSKLVLNKDDFCYWTVPVSQNNFKGFEFLTFEEIKGLDDISREKYYTDKENNVMDDKIISEIQDEIEREDEMTYNIENLNHSTDSGNEYDDY
jgi:hypothetical protein